METLPRPVRSSMARSDEASSWRRAEGAAALGATFLLALRFQLHPQVPLGYVVALAALPVTLGVVARYRGAKLIVGLSAVAVLSGALLTWTTVPFEFVSPSQYVIQGGRVLMIGVGTLLLLWARSIVGSRAVVMTYALGSFAALAVVGINFDNPWKFSFAVPATLLLLSLKAVYRRPTAEMAILVALGIFSAFQDSRSAAAIMLVAGALILTGRGSKSGRGNSATVLIRLGLLGVGGFFLLQAALLSGDLGEDARARTMTQIETSGSVLLGGRPELGASVALLGEQPWGYGIGTLVTPTQVDVAKTGMAALGYDPNNGYVENYMFGNGIEVHSVVGNLWLLTGIPGMFLALAVIGYVTWGMAHHLSRRIASGAMVFLAVRALWDFAFAPLPSAMLTLMLCLALTLPRRSHSRSSVTQQ